MSKINTKAETLSAPNVERIAFIAALISTEAPENASDRSHWAYVRWELIDELRSQLEQAGMDWRAACRHYRQAIKERRGT